MPKLGKCLFREEQLPAGKNIIENKYMETMLEEARKAFLREAGHYNVPKTKRIDRLTGRRGTKLDRSTELNGDNEEIIEGWILLLVKWGFPLRKKTSPI
jgi:hypothetical protein